MSTTWTRPSVLAALAFAGLVACGADQRTVQLDVRPPAVVTVERVIDGDTIVTSAGRVRLAGIDTPEVGDCGSAEATRRLEQSLAAGQALLVPTGGPDDVDRYGRLLRYVEVHGVDVADALLAEGLAVARYDSRDGYGSHDREVEYWIADGATPSICQGGHS